jgi:hypothetical protein
LPPNIAVTESLAQALQLADSGVEESVLLAHITNSAGPFNLGADEIIFLTDIGLSTPVVAAMLEHDRFLKEAAARALAAWRTVEPEPEPEPAISAPTYENWPEPGEGVMPIAYTEPYPAAQPAEEAASYFYDSLSPYGDWIDVEGYGRCWQPSVVVIHKNWRPYCDRGRWVFTDCGWYWVSDYSWGWAPFHYGRWFQHSRVGWCWVPDKIWGPSWVSWRYNDEHCGWAPLPPRAHFTGSGFIYNGRAVAMNSSFGLAADCYTFVPFDRFQDSDLSHHVIAQKHVDRFIHKTTLSTKILGGRQKVVNVGLPREQVTAVTRREVRKTTIREVTPDAAQVIRPEQLETDGQILSIVRPNWRPPRRPGRSPEVRQASATSPPEQPSSPGRPAWLHTLPHASPQTVRHGGTALAAAQQQPSAPVAPHAEVAARVVTATPVAADVIAPLGSAAPYSSGQRPRRLNGTRSPAAQIISAEVDPNAASAQPASYPIRTQPPNHWQRPVVHHSEPSQPSQPERPHQAAWHVPSAVPRVVVPDSAPIRTPPPAAISHSETPRWERPRQEVERPAEPTRPAAESRNSGWQAPQHSVEHPTPPAPAPSSRAESSSRTQDSGSGSRQRR